MADILTLLALALVLDAVLGEPDFLWARLPHPAVLMGRAVSWLEARLNRGALRRAKGVAAVLALVAGSALLGWALAAIPVVGPVLSGLVAAILLAQKSLVQHVGAVAPALETSLAEGRQTVALIVGRDPEALDASGVARAAIESGAENFSDGVVAPAFWFAVAGLPGILVYKAVNTADSMIGHRSERYRAFGWAAARLDDGLNLGPARLSALMIAAATLSRRGARHAWSIARRDARLHRSPNAGWPEAAAAAALGIAVSGPRSYAGVPTDDPFVHPEGRRDLTPMDIRATTRLLWLSWGMLLATVVLATLCVEALAWIF